MSHVPVDVSALRALPPRRPADPPGRASRIQWDPIRPDGYVVRIAGETVGFIDVVGAVYVVLAGCRYDKAVEVAQTLMWSAATATLDHHHSRLDERRARR